MRHPQKTTGTKGESLMGIPFPGTLASAADSLLQTMPVPLPSPVPATGSAGGAGAGTGAGGGLDSLPRDRSRERNRPCKCPPDKGDEVTRRYGMSPKARRYQARITGYAYGIDTDAKGRETRGGWNKEWKWLGTDFDGFVKAQCLLQEAKDDYDQFLDEDDEPIFWFTGFKSMADTIADQSIKVRANPPSRLMWYFGTPRARDYMMPTLVKNGVPSVYQP
ncbi:Restriction endonuclease fold toxin 5 [Paraburkholderia tropica]|nr:Restriction endonuclease fold toxin 5 [Paraburkholderia tropica]